MYFALKNGVLVLFFLSVFLSSGRLSDVSLDNSMLKNFQNSLLETIKMKLILRWAGSRNRLLRWWRMHKTDEP